MLKPIKNYPFPKDLIVVGKSMNNPINPVARFVPGGAFAFGGIMLIWLDVFIAIVMIIIGLTLLILFNAFNHFLTIGKYGDNAISYYEAKDLILIRKWKDTYELPFNSIIKVNTKKCFGSRDSSTSYTYIGGQRMQTTTSWDTGIRKIVFTYKQGNSTYDISVPVESAYEVYFKLDKAINERKATM